ncbi:MAG: FtsX-like permease family protein [Candidatus Thorarchaeota archaeon]
MASRISRLWALIQLNRLHWSASKRRILISVAIISFVIALSLAIYSVREAHYDDLLKVYEQKNPINSNYNPSIEFWLEGNHPQRWLGLPLDLGNQISSEIRAILEESALNSVVAETYLTFQMGIFVFRPTYNDTFDIAISAVSEAVLSEISSTLVKGRPPANSSEVLANREHYFWQEVWSGGYELDPENASLAVYGLHSFEESFDASDNQTLDIVGIIDSEIVETNLAGRFPEDFLRRLGWSAMLTSFENLVEFVNRFDYYWGYSSGTVDIEWRLEKIRVRDIGLWQKRARAFGIIAEKPHYIQGNRINFSVAEEFSKLLSDFKEEQREFDSTYLLLSIPLLILFLLVLLEVNSLGSDSQARELNLLYLNGLRLGEAASLLIVERLVVALISTIIGAVASPLFINLAQTLLPGLPSRLDPVNSFQELFSLQIIVVVASLIFLASIPSVASPLRRAETIRHRLVHDRRIWKRSYVILATIIGFAAFLLLFSEFVSPASSDFLAISIILLAIPAILIRIINRLSSWIGSKIWQSHSRKATIALQLFREEVSFFSRPALVMFLLLMILVPALFVTPSINSHLTQESKLVVGSNILVDNWNDTISTDAIRNTSKSIADTSIVHYVLLEGAFPPLWKRQSILVIDPASFAKTAFLKLESRGQLISDDSIKQLSTNKTMLLGLKTHSMIERGDIITFKAWERNFTENRTEFTPHQFNFQIVDRFSLFPVLSSLTKAAFGNDEGNYRECDEIVMSHDSWDQLVSLFQLDSSITYSMETKLLIKLEDPSRQEQVAKEIYRTFDYPTNTSNSVKESFESPFHGSYAILSDLTIMIGLLVIVAIAVTSANTLLNRRKQGIEVLLQMGMARRTATLIAAQEFAIAIIIPIVLGTIFGLVYLFSMEGVLSVYTNLLEFQWLVNPAVLLITISFFAFFTYVIWIASFYIAISRHKFTAEE